MFSEKDFPRLVETKKFQGKDAAKRFHTFVENKSKLPKIAVVLMNWRITQQPCFYTSEECNVFYHLSGEDEKGQKIISSEIVQFASISNPGFDYEVMTYFGELYYINLNQATSTSGVNFTSGYLLRFLCNSFPCKNSTFLI